MEEIDKKLYPLRFLDEGEGMPWGHVSYQIADLGFKDSMIADGWFGGNTLSELMGTYMERVVGDEAFEYYGLQFPLMVKVMDVTGWQPLQVNVPDKIAEERYDSFGKTAFWYIREASDDAVMYLGLNRDVPAGEFYGRCQDGTVTEVLNEVRPKKGDCFILSPGTVFAAGPGLTIIEIAECSELALNLHGWGRSLPGPEEILLEEAFDFIDFSRYSPEGATPQPPVLADCPEFKVTKMELRDPVRMSSEQPGSFAIYHCLSGEALVDNRVRLKTGHSILLPSELNDYTLFPASNGTVLLEALVGRRETAQP